MSFPLGSVAEFFREDVAPVNIYYVQGQGTIREMMPLTRIEFLVGSGLGLLFAIKKAAEAVISLLGTFFTLASELNQSFREALVEDLKGVVTYLLAYPIGLAGAIAPGFINQHLLDIPPEGRRSPTDFFRGLGLN